MERSLSKKGYLKNFVQKKLVVLLLRYWYVDLILIPLMAVMYCNYDDLFARVMSTFTTPPHWYIFQLATFYFLFYVISISVKDGRRRMIVMTISVIAVMNIQYYQFDSSALYRRSGFGFVLGMLLAHRLDEFIGIEKRKRIWICILCGAVLLFNELLDGDFTTYISPMLFSALILFMSTLEGRWMPWIAIVLGIVAYPFSTSLSAPLLLVGACSIPVSAGIMKQLGRYSLELYLLHYQIMAAFYNSFGIEDATVLFICTMSLTLATALFVKHTADRVVAHYNRRVDEVSAA